MKNGGNNVCSFLLALLFAGIMTGTAYAADKQYESSLVCKSCHEETYKEWNGSMHANALSDPIFQGVLAGEKDKSICISCHAPTTRLTGDFNITGNVTKEAINCDFCHTISGLNMSNPLQPFILSPGEIKYGQYADSSPSKAHKSQNLSLLAKAEFCGACHDVAFPNGLVVLGTYTEWKASEYAKNGTQCQACHMRAVKRSIATGAPERNDSTRHLWRGGHSTEMLQAAGKLDIDAKTEGSKVLITAVVANERAGHKFPTGSDSRLILEVAATGSDGKVLFQDRKTFSKVYGDANGSPVILPDFATQILSDTRIPPKGRSTAEFSFDAPDYEGDVRITGMLLYRLVPEEIAPMPATKILEVNRTVKVTREISETPKAPAPGFELAFAVIGFAAVYLLGIRKRE